MTAHEQLFTEFNRAIQDETFTSEVNRLRRNYVNGPTPIHFAKRLTAAVGGGAQIWFKREELAHTGSHKLNNAIGQVLLAKRMGKTRIIAETGAGQHGVATATACAYLGLSCVVYMGSVDVERQHLNVCRIKMLGAEVVPVESGSRTLKDAVNEALKDWVASVQTTHYVIGSAIGPHPFPEIVRYFQSVIGRESRQQMLCEGEFAGSGGPGRLPDVVVACVGGGSNAIGIFSGFIDDATVKLVGVEAGGQNGPIAGRLGGHAAPLSAGTPGVFHGNYSYLMQTDQGQVVETSSISAGLDYPGVGPEHSFLKDSGRAQYVWATDSQAIAAMQQCSMSEGIIPALEPSHALAYATQMAAKMNREEIVLVHVCGRGDKDMETVSRALGLLPTKSVTNSTSESATDV
eukprot:GHVS01091784.1.p1 GENE.GHVS01091784.1~~GHVS01091784.1.p1  ORF type:complete len:403 (+),score=45.38 GHVS01091784.1:189-1397(+)